MNQKNNNNNTIYMILGIIAIAIFALYPNMVTPAGSNQIKGSVNAEAQKEVKEPTLEELALEKEKQAKELAEKERILQIEKAVNTKEKEILDLKKSASQSAVDTAEDSKKE